MRAPSIGAQPALTSTRDRVRVRGTPGRPSVMSPRKNASSPDRSKGVRSFGLFRDQDAGPGPAECRARRSRRGGARSRGGRHGRLPRSCSSHSFGRAGRDHRQSGPTEQSQSGAAAHQPQFLVGRLFDVFVFVYSCLQSPPSHSALACDLPVIKLRSWNSGPRLTGPCLPLMSWRLCVVAVGVAPLADVSRPLLRLPVPR